MNTSLLRSLRPFGALAALGLIAMLLPREWLRAFDWVGYAVCHRIPERSFFVAAQQLPVCARDTGMFIGTLTGAAWLAAALRQRAALYPARPWIFLFAAFFLAWALDGFNSYLLLLRGEPLLYMPQNWLRLTTGAFMGVTLAPFAAAIYNQGFWRDAVMEPTVSNGRAMAGLIVCALVVIGAALWAPPALLGPLSAFSAAGVLLLLTLVNAMSAAMLRRRHGTFQHLRELVPYVIVGVLLSIAEIAAITSLRAWALPGAVGTLP
jgi:uncharacterized membrane protein